MKQEWKHKNTIITMLISMILIVVAISIFSSNEIIVMKLYSFVGSVAIMFFGIIGIFEFAYHNGFNFIVLDSYIKLKEKTEYDRMKKAVQLFFEKEINYFIQYDHRRISYFMEQLGISKNKFDKIRLELIKARMMPLKNKEDACQKLNVLIKTPSLIIDQEDISSEKRLYPIVRYYINFVDLMFDQEFCAQIVDIMGLYIIETLGDRIQNINKIIMPYNSNYLLCFELSKKLGIPFVKMSEKERIYVDQFWDGDFSTQKSYNVIIVHDVLVTADQIIKSMNKLPMHCTIDSIFCLINRKTDKYNAIERLESENNMHNKVHSILSIGDDDISKYFEDDEL